jgi:hypothetical protein
MVEDDPAIDSAGRVLTTAFGGTLNRVFDNGNNGSLETLASGIDGQSTSSPLVLADDDIVFGTTTGKVYRYTSSGAQAWLVSASGGSPITGLIAAAAGSPDGARIYAVTASSRVVALRADGTAAWAASGDLRGASLVPPSIAPARPGRLPTLVTGSVAGRIYGVVVDTALDTTAPWPKIHHDLRNTGNAGTPLP